VTKKEEIIDALKKCAEKLGHVPCADEFRKATGLNKYQIRTKFGSYVKLLREAGLEVSGYGRMAEMRGLFLDWAGIVRSLKKIPTIAEYDLHSKYSVRPLTGRFKGWKLVAAGMRDYAVQEGLEGEFRDVMDAILDHLQPTGKDKIFNKTSGSTSKPTIMANQLVYGPPLSYGPMAYAPVNENGVLLLFGAFARDLGFSILHVQPGFPDCEAMREIEPGRWQRVRIEIEYQSRNFIPHGHPISGCEVIVCWEHNWPDCPLEVIELKKVMENWQKAK
jgi:hypothetical protein